MIEVSLEPDDRQSWFPGQSGGTGGSEQMGVLEGFPAKAFSLTDAR